MRCSSPNCPTDRAEGSRFCEFHRDILAHYRDEIAAGSRSRLRTPKRTKRLPKRECDMLGCQETAEPREPYCVLHLEILERRASEA